MLCFSVPACHVQVDEGVLVPQRCCSSHCPAHQEIARQHHDRGGHQSVVGEGDVLHTQETERELRDEQKISDMYVCREYLETMRERRKREYILSLVGEVKE